MNRQLGAVLGVASAGDGSPYYRVIRLIVGGTPAVPVYRVEVTNGSGALDETWTTNHPTEDEGRRAARRTTIDLRDLASL